MWPLASGDAPAEIIARKVAERERLLAEASKRLKDVPLADDLPFLSCPAKDIALNILARKPGWTATRVLEAFARAAIRSHKTTNALTEIMLDQAFARAEQLDADFKRTGKIVGPMCVWA